MKVAIAGGGSSVGRHIYEAILTRKTHDLVILSRRPLPELEQLGAHVAIVDFHSQESLVVALAGVNTVISAISLRPDPVKSVEVDIGLIHAAQKVGAKRFIANGWAGKQEGPEDPVALYRLKQPVSLPSVPVDWNGRTGYLKPGKYWIDIEECKATIPGDGTQEVVYTAVEDVGDFVAQALDLDEWPQELHIIGERLSPNEVIKIGERIRGQSFSVTYQTEDELRALIIPDPPSPFTNALPELTISLIHGRYTLDANLADKLNMRLTNISEFIEKWWGDGPAIAA